MISYIIPTRDRPDQLQGTLAALDALHQARPDLDAEVLIADNASADPVRAPQRLGGRVDVRVLFRPTNEGAAARNAAAHAARGEWLVMLDDDSAPLDLAFTSLLDHAPPDLAALGAEIFLPSGARESGGLPEVFIGCAVALRRDAFLDAGGYDANFNYYAEEYDLAARLLLAGLRVAHDRRFRVLHRKVSAGRDMNTILHRLVRNNAWIDQRYTPEPLRAGALARTLSRYEGIARRESALEGYEAGVRELESTLADQPRRPMPAALYDRFTGLAHARAHLAEHAARLGLRDVALIARGKHDHLIEQALGELSVRVVEPGQSPQALVVATLSPGPMLDAADAHAHERTQVLCPWALEGAPPQAAPARRAA